MKDLVGQSEFRASPFGVFVRAPTEGAVVESGGISAHGETTSDGHGHAT